MAEPEKVVESIDAIYDEIHESYKVGSIFMEHYNFTDPRKDLTKKSDTNKNRKFQSTFKVRLFISLIFSITNFSIRSSTKFKKKV